MTITYIDDLASPTFPEEGKKVLAELAAIPIGFSMDDIINHAESQLDVPLFRDEYMLDSLERFIMEGNTRAGGFTPAGKGMFASLVSNLIVHRSRLEALYQRHPEINDIELVDPIVIAGPPRSGTSNLANIFGADTRLNSLPRWEGDYPMPSIGMMNGEEEDDRALFYKKSLEALISIRPLWRTLMDVPYDGVIEEIALMHFAGMPLVALNWADVPKWRHWFWHEMEPKPLYEFTKRMLKALQWLRGNNQRWVLKSPHHLAFLPVIEEVFDNATFIITHRDPASSTVSNATMIAYAFRVAYAKPDLMAAYQVAMDMANGMLGGLVRDIDKINPAKVEHVYFHNYMDDTLGTMRKLYQTVNLEWTEQAQNELQGYIDSHPRGRHGIRIGYKPERDFNKSRDDVRTELQFYLDKFPNIKIETNQS